jgi:hypothetical protein
MAWFAEDGAFGFFDADKRLVALSAKGNPSKQSIDWCHGRPFAPTSRLWLTPDEMRKSSAGRKALDAIVMFWMLVLPCSSDL